MGKLRLKSGRKWLCRALVLAAFALAAGFGWSWIKRREHLPDMAGNVWAMVALDDTLLMVLSQGSNNCLVQTGYDGHLIHYAATAANQAYQSLDVDGETIYAIQNTFQKGRDRQTLVSFSTARTVMRAQTLLVPDRPEGGAQITWKEVYAPTGGEDTVRMAGIDAAGQGWLLRWDRNTGQPALEKVLEGESLYALKYVAPGHYVWIDWEGRVGQEIGGVRQRDVWKDLADTPYHISTCGTRCFVGDSATGNIYELLPDGRSELYRRGEDRVGGADYFYQEMELFTTHLEPDGTVHVLGMCSAPDGGGSVVAGDSCLISRVKPGQAQWAILWSHCWRAAAVIAIAAWLALALAALMFRSRRLVVRLAACEVVAALALTGALSVMQLLSFREALLEEAKQKLKVVGGSMALPLTSDVEMGREEMENVIGRVFDQMELSMGYASAREYEITVFWIREDRLEVGFDLRIPTGCLGEDVAEREYLAEVKKGIETDGQVQSVRRANHTDYLYVQAFSQGSRRGCVAVSQAEGAISSSSLTFFDRLLPVLAVCPALFLGLILMTRRLLRPLGDIRRALETFYDRGSGNTVALEGMPQTELYEIARVFNALSVQTRVQFNDLATINAAYARLVPDSLLRMLGKKSVQELSAGDSAGVDGAVLMLLPERPERTAQGLEALWEPAARQIRANEGFLVDHDEQLGALTAVFSKRDQAQECAWRYLDGGGRVMAGIFAERVEVGVFGSEELLYPIAVSQKLNRRQAALKRLQEFGAILVYSGDVPESAGLRLLGWDDGLSYYEDTALRESAWRTQWNEASALWEQAMELFRTRSFAQAMRKFARALHILPGTDGAARWYLFRCDTLRDAPEEVRGDTALLFEWREEHGEDPAS